MTFNDIFKSSFLENVTAVSLPDMALALVLSFGLGMFIYFVYRKTYAGVMFSQSFGGSLIAMTMITTVVILAVTSNVVLSLGMVGALSIVTDERLEVGVSFRSDSEFFTHIVRSAQHRAVASVAQHAYVLARKLEKVAVKGGNDDIVFPGKPDGIRGYYVVGLKLLDLGVPQSEVVKRRVYVGKL